MLVLSLAAYFCAAAPQWAAAGADEYRAGVQRASGGASLPAALVAARAALHMEWTPSAIIASDGALVLMTPDCVSSRAYA